MMMAPVASRWNVSGIRIAVPAEAPNPGSTPISVPSTQPTKAYSRYCSESAAASPDIRCCSPSTRFLFCGLLETEDPDGQHHLEQVEEHVEHAEAPHERAGRDDDRAPHAQRHEQERDEEQHGKAEAD